MLPFRLVCLGQPQLFGPDGEPVRFRTRKHLALLVYLAVEPPRAHRRDQLATLLWPDAELEDARHSLATALSVLRGRLGSDAFDSTRDTVRLRSGRVATDTEGIRTEEWMTSADEAIGLFLQDFDIPNALAFGHWVDTTRARLIPLIHDSLLLSIERYRCSGNLHRMMLAAEHLAAVDELSEHAVRALIEVRTLAGDRMGALRLFDRWRLRAAEEFGAAPSRALLELASRIRRGTVERPQCAAKTHTPFIEYRHSPIVGRELEYRACYQAWQQAKAGASRLILVQGENGVGKTTIVDRVASAVALEGASTVSVQGFSLERDLPLGFISTLVSELVDLPGAGGADPRQLAVLSSLSPKVHQRWPGLPPSGPDTREDARLRIAQAIVALLLALSEEAPLVIVLDDFHQADPISLAVAHLVLRRAQDLPLLVLMTASPQPKGEEASRYCLSQLTSSLEITTLDVEPLRPLDAQELLQSLLADDDPGPSVRRAILIAANGNPLQLVQLVSDWRQRGDQSFALTFGAMTTAPTTSPALLTGHLLSGVLSALDPDTRAVADLAAVLGRRLNDLTMYTLVESPLPRTLRAITTLMAHRVLRDSGGRLEFASESVRHTWYMAIAAPMRRALHSCVADRLQSAPRNTLNGASQLEVAWHLVRAGRTEDAAPFLLTGAREAIRLGAPHEAEIALRTGISTLQGRERRIAQLLWAESLQELGQWSSSIRVLNHPEDSITGPDAHWQQVLRVIGDHWSRGDARSEHELCVQALGRIAASRQPADVRVRALNAIPYLLSYTHDSSGMDHFRGALDSFDRSSLEPYDHLQFLSAAAWYYANVGDVTHAVALLETAVGLIDDHGYRSSVAIRTLIGAASTKLMSGEYSSAPPLLDRAMRLATELDNRLHRAAASASMAIATGRLGNVDQQIAYATLSLDTLRGKECSIIAIAASFERALGLALSNHANDARLTMDNLVSWSGPQAPAWQRQGIGLLKADILKLLGEERRATSVARSALSLGTDRPLALDFAGPFARWQALASTTHASQVRALEGIRKSVLPLRGIHEKDRAEALASVVLLEARLGRETSDAPRELQRALARLPRHLTQVNQRLGLMQTAGTGRGEG